MRTMRWIAGAVLATAATAASAQMYWGRTYDPYWDRPDYRSNAEQECWNPRAGHFERVRPGEVQNDLDFRRCRLAGYAENDRYYDRRDWREERRECWNPRARHYEEVRRGEYQDDLDFSRCRIVRY